MPFFSIHSSLLELSLPKFSMSSTTDMQNLLMNMDPEIEAKLLGSQAEFSQLSNIKPFTIDKVTHMSDCHLLKTICTCITNVSLSSQAVNKVMFEMSEEGAEPEVMTPESGVPLKLSINRPFFFSVIEGDSNTILMLGKITNPTL